MKFTLDVAQRYFICTEIRVESFTSIVISNNVQFNRRNPLQEHSNVVRVLIKGTTC